MKSRVQRAVTACSCIVVSAAAAGCGGTASAAEQTVNTARAQDSTVITAQPEPFSLVVQMTGLLLLVPPKQPNGNTEVFMPTVANHDAVIGFKVSSDPGYCDVPYNNALKICYVKMNGWSLSVVQTGASGGVLPKGAVNLTRFGGRPINVADARTRSRAEVTLLPGIVTDTCSLASWTFNPVGNEGPERLSFINVMEWVVPRVTPENLSLVLTSKDNSAEPRPLGPLVPNDQNELELLIMHLPPVEWKKITGAPLHPSEPIAPADVTPNISGEMTTHFNAFYHTIDPLHFSLRPIPQRPRKLRDVCPITILGLETSSRNEGEQRGTKTLSCVMASAEQS